MSKKGIDKLLMLEKHNSFPIIPQNEEKHQNRVQIWTVVTGKLGIEQQMAK